MPSRLARRLAHRLASPAAAVALALLAAAGCGSSARSSIDVDASTPPSPDAAVPACVDGTRQCLGTTYQTCVGGAWTTTQECTVACDQALGCVLCAPGTKLCKDGDVYACDAQGNPGALVTACTGSTVCEAGACVDACAAAVTNKSYQGCEYWAVDLDNALEVIDVAGSATCAQVTGAVTRSQAVCADATGGLAGTCEPPANACPSGYTCQTKSVCVLDAAHAPFAVVVSNPQARPVDVTLANAAGGAVTRTVPAGGVVALQPQGLGLPDASVDGTSKAALAYKLTSTLPIIAYQFNPLDNANVFSNDASLLIPRTAFDTDYYVMSYKTLDRSSDPLSPSNDYRGYLAIVAWQDGTQVEVTPSAGIVAGVGQAALTAGQTYAFTLNAFEVLNLEAGKTGDLTGTRVRAPAGQAKTFGVFGGHEATNVVSTANLAPDALHSAGPCCADHLEEMMFGTSTWGKTFAVARSQARATERDTVRIMAQQAGTTVTLTPAPISGSCGTLAAGGFCEVELAADTAITASAPVLVGHYLQSAIWQDPFFGDAVGEGDPSLALAVPTEQYRTSYAVLVPSAYAKNFLSVTAPGAGAITLDGADVTAAMQPFGGGYRAGRLPVQPGAHRVACPAGCGVEVYGYSDAVSYLFAGGLDLRAIVIN